jgi:hypothetical protein
VVRLSINSIDVDSRPVGDLCSVEIKGFILSKNTGILNEILVNAKDIIITTDLEQRMIDLQKSKRKSNPLMVNFEEYE